MRQVDEILWAFPTQDALARRYLVRQLERQPVTVDSAEAMVLLRGARDGEVGDYARLAEDAFFSRREEDRLRRAGGEPPKEAGDWTRFLGQAAGEAVEVPGEHLERAANACLSPLVAPLHTQFQQGGRWASAGLSVLARIRVPASLSAIREVSGPGPMAPLCMAAYSVFGGAQAGEHALELAARRSGTPVFQGMIHSFRGVASAETFAYLRDLSEKAPQFHAGIASALEGYAEQDYQQVLDAVLSAAKDPWAVIHAVETMGRIGDKHLLPRVATILQKIEHPLVQVVCLHAAAESRDREAGKIALAALRSKNPVVQAAAVEALIKLPLATRDYGDQVLALLDAQHPKLALNVALACVVLDPRRAVRRVKDLLGSGNLQHLLQGIHCLAYMDYPASAGILSQAVRKSPAGPLRIQAVRALGRRASHDPQSAVYLAKLMDVDDPSTRQAVAWFLAGAHPAARKGLTGVLVKSLARAQDEATGAAMAEALGLLGPDAAQAVPALAQLVQKGGAVGQAAAWSLAVAFPETAEAKHLVESRDPGIRARGLLGRWVLGGEGVETVAGLLSTRNEAEFVDVAGIAREMAETAVFADTVQRLKGLSRSLADYIESAAFREREEALGIVVEIEDPDADRSTASSDEIAAEAQRAAVSTGQAAALGTGRRRERSSYGGQEVRLKGPTGNVAASAMPSEEEAAEAMEAARQASTEDADAAVRKATYFAGDQPVQPGTPPSGSPSQSVTGSTQVKAQSRGQLVWTFVQLVFFATVAIALGRLVRMLVLGSY